MRLPIIAAAEQLTWPQRKRSHVSSWKRDESISGLQRAGFNLAAWSGMKRGDGTGTKEIELKTDERRERSELGRTRRRKVIGASLVVASLLAVLVVAPPSEGIAAASADADPAVITDRNATAVPTIVLDAGKANADR